MERSIKTRIINKHATEYEWLNIDSFIPYQGELIVYDRDDTYPYERFKIGDGHSNVNDLPFTLDALLPDIKEYIDETILNGEW